MTERINGRAAAVAASTFVILIAMFLWAHGPVRSFVGDVVVVLFLVAGFAAVRAGGPVHRLVGVGAFALGIEALQALQWVGPDAHWFLHLTVGATADPWDVLAYGLGLGLAVAAEAWWGSK